MNIKNLIFIPCYNCEIQILRVLKKLVILSEIYYFDVIIINNKSCDKTSSNIKQFFLNKNINPIKNNFKLFENKENYGLGGSHKIAYEYFYDHNYENLIIHQGDDQGDPEDLLIALQEKENDTKLIMGSRFKNLNKIRGYSKIKIIFNLTFNIIASIILKKKIYELSSGQLIINRDLLKNKTYKKFPNELWFNYYFFFYNILINSKYEFCEIKWVEEDQISNLKVFNQLMELIILLFKINFQKEKYFEKLNDDNIKYSYEVYNLN